MGSQELSDTEETTEANAPLVPAFRIAIAESSNIRMPSFFGYIMKWSLPILVPLFIVVTWIFF